MRGHERIFESGPDLEIFLELFLYQNSIFCLTVEHFDTNHHVFIVYIIVNACFGCMYERDKGCGYWINIYPCVSLVSCLPLFIGILTFVCYHPGLILRERINYLVLDVPCKK